MKSEDKFVYIVEDSKGNTVANFSTGTRVYTREKNAINRCNEWCGQKVVKYRLEKVDD